MPNPENEKGNLNNDKREYPSTGKESFVCGNDIFLKNKEYIQIEKERLSGEIRTKGLAKDYIPKKTDPVKIICLNFHIFRMSDGSGHYQKSDKYRIKQIMMWLNEIYAYPEISSDAEHIPTNNPSPTDHVPGNTIYTALTDSRIRFKLNRLEFYDDDVLFHSSSVGALQAAALARNPSTLDQLNVYFNHGDPLGTGFASLPSYNMNFNSFVVQFIPYLQPTPTDHYPNDYMQACLLAHELGHTLDLVHTYNGGGAPAVCNVGPDFLIDVFGSPSSCPHICDWGRDCYIHEPWQPNTVVTNNMMGGNKNCHWISKLQAGFMHRALAEKNVKRYIASSCNDCIKCLAFTVRGWDHTSQGADAKLYYSMIDLNESWGWNGEDFIAPISGIYHFDLSFVKDAFQQNGTQLDVYVFIRKRTQTGDVSDLAYALSGNGSGMRGTGCVSINVNLKAGDIVSTEVNTYGGETRHLVFYCFSGQYICNNCL